MLLTICMLGALGQEPYTPSVDELTVHRALSARHDQPSCDAIDALVPSPTATLLSLVEHAATPPWVPMRAASCLNSRHSHEPLVRAAISDWVTKAELMGLGIQTLDQLPLMPEDTAMSVAQEALAAGPSTLHAAERIRRDPRPNISALPDGP